MFLYDGRMTPTAKNAPLKWTVHRTWPADVYRSDAPGWEYEIDQVRRGHWVLRGWGPDTAFLYQYSSTLGACKALAEQHYAGVKGA